MELTFSINLRDNDDAQYFRNWLRRCGVEATNHDGIVYTSADVTQAYHAWRRLFAEPIS